MATEFEVDYTDIANRVNDVAKEIRRRLADYVRESTGWETKANDLPMVKFVDDDDTRRTLFVNGVEVADLSVNIPAVAACERTPYGSRVTAFNVHPMVIPIYSSHEVERARPEDMEEVFVNSATQLVVNFMLYAHAEKNDREAYNRVVGLVNKRDAESFFKNHQW